MRKPKPSLYLRFRQPDGKQSSYCRAIFDGKSRLRPFWCLVRGTEEHHPEATHYQRTKRDGKGAWESLGTDPAAAWNKATVGKSVDTCKQELSLLCLPRLRPTYFLTADQGVFLAETRRLHPDVCAFTSELFYEGRLVSRPENAKQRLNAGEPLGGTGLRFAPVEHTGNQNESTEEVERVAAMVEGLLRAGATWTDKEDKTNALRLQDILIVAPYNAQVSALTDRLSTGSRVGTVDKFQGQQAAVVFYSMATSTPEDAPRGMEFLYSLNRLNVAISRARCVAVIVASPALFQVQCRNPRQIELANAFCRYLEMARRA